MAYNRKKEMEEAKKRLDREKASGKVAPKKTALNTNQATVQSFVEDRPKRLAAKIGSPRKEDAMITYENKKFNKRKKTKNGGNFAWDGDMLKGLSTKKYGKSYAAKFEKLANEAGIPQAERGAFKDYLDAKEYGANPNAKLDEARYTNDSRVAATQKKNKREQAEVNKVANETKAKAEAKKSYQKESDSTKKNTNLFQDILDLGKGAVDSAKAFLPGGESFGETLLKNSQKVDKKQSDAFSGTQRFANRTGNSALLGLPAQMEKNVTGEQSPFQNKREFGEGGGTDLVADLLGYAAPGVGITKAVRGTKLGADVSKGALTKAGALTRAKEGASVGALMSTGEVGGREALNPEDYTWKQNAAQIGLETLGGAALDPLISALGPLAKMGADRTMKGAVNSSNQDLVSRMLQGVGDVPRMPSPLDDMRPQNPLDDLIKRSQAQQVQAPRLDIPNNQAQGDEALANYTRQYEEAQNLASQSRQAKTNPQGLTDYEPNFTMRDTNQLLLGAPNQASTPKVPRPDAPLQEKLAYWKDPEMARTDTDVREIITTMGDLESNIKQFQDNLPQLREVEMSKFPEETSIYRNARSYLKEYNEAEDLWRNAKEVQATFKNPKTRPEWAKFSLDSKLKNSEESGLIPKRFIAKGTDINHGTDFAKAMDLAGFDNEVDFINHLKYIDEQLKIGPRKNLSTLGAADYKKAEESVMKFEQDFENDLKQQFGIADMEQQLDELSSLATPYEPPTQSPLPFKRTQTIETTRDPITEILYPNNQYGVERDILNSPRSEAAVTTNEAPVRTEPESLAIEQAPSVAQSEPKMVRVKQQENLQSQAVDVVVEQGDALKTIISKGTKDSDKYAKRIIDTATKNPVLKVFRKYRQSMVGSMNSATYAEKDLLKKAIPDVKNRLDSSTDLSERANLQYELDELHRRVKASKDTSYTQMALENETGADIKASIISNDFVKKLNSIEGATIQEMMNWQTAQRIMWLQSPENAAKELPDEWVSFAKQTLEDGQGNPAFQQSEAIFRELQETRLKNVSQQKSPEEIEALLKEPYYIPLYRDNVAKASKGANVEKKIKGMRSQPRTSSTEIDTIKAFQQEDAVGSDYGWIRNPIDSVIDDLFREQRSIARNDTAQQFRKLGQMDDLGTYVREVDENVFKAENGETNPQYLKGFEDGEPFYLQIHSEFSEMLKGIDSIEGVDPIQMATSIMSRLKTTSPEYLATAIPRDIATSFMNTENVVDYATGLWKALTDEAYKKTGIDAGVQFRNAYDPQSAAQQGSEQLQKQITKMSGVTDVDASNLEKATDLVSKAWEKLTWPTRKIGQISDDVPRIIEANIVKKRWETNVLSKTREAIAKVEAELQTAPQGDFEAGPQLQGQLEQLQKRLDMETRGMEREMTHRGRDVMPYQRSGSSFLAKGFKKYVNFANTTTQSKDKLARTFARQPIQTALKGAALSAPIGIMIHQMYDGLSTEEKQMYDAIPDYMKQQRYVVPLGGDKYVSLPKVQELAILTNMADADAGLMSYESALEYAGRELTPFQLGGTTQGLIGASFVEPDGDNPGGATLKNFQDNVVLPGTVASPLMDIGLNTKSSFNRKPVSFSRDGKSGDYTMDIFDKMTGGSDWADGVQYGTQQYTGDWGKYGLGLLDRMIAPSSEDSKASNQSLNPLQDYIYNPESDVFKQMFYDKNKLPK